MEILINKNILIVIYFIFTAILIYKFKFKLYSFLTLFISYTFITYFLGYIIFEYYPELSTLIPLPKNRNHGYFNENYYHYSFFIFLIGYIFFSIPFFIFKNNKFNLNKIKIDLNLRKIKIINLFIIFILMNFFSFAIRKNFNVGVPTGIPNNKIAEYVWYTFDYLTIILLIYVIYNGLLSKSLFYNFLSFISPFIYGITVSILGWKSGFIWAFIITLHIMTVLKYFYNENVRFIKTKICVFFLVTVLLMPSIFIMSNDLRSDKNFLMKMNLNIIVNKINYYFDKPINAENIIYIFNRITGISPLFITVAYEDVNSENNVSFFSNLFQRGTYQPETYFGCDLLKIHAACPPPTTTFAPTSWSIFYIYNGIYGVMIGFFILGVISSLLEYLFLHSNNKSIIITIYTATFSISFPAMIFEGTIAFYFKRHLLSLLLAFIIFLLFLLLINKLKKLKSAY